MRREESGGITDLFGAVAGLKTTARTGWLDRGVPPEQVESVADHSYGVALLAWAAAAADPTLDRERVLQLALIHDLAEAITGDQTPYDPDDLAGQPGDKERTAFLNRRHEPGEERRTAKRVAEAAAFARIVAGLPEELHAELSALRREYEARATPEARFVKQVDRLETYLQSLAYARAYPGLPVASFAAEVAAAIEHPALVAIRDAAAASAEADRRRGIRVET